MMNFLNNKTAVIIPIRMGSTRLPGKFHADIAGKPMIHHVIDRAKESGLTNIFVACDHQQHFDLITNYGVKAIMTSVDHQSGSDRSYEALNLIDPNGKFEYIVNLQGDMPFFNSEVITEVLALLENDPDADISTVASSIIDEEDINDHNVVKVIFNNIGHALYFSRAPIPHPMSNIKPDYFYHVGIYAYRRDSLKKYVNLPQSKLELVEKLEQLRALENGMKISVGVTKNVPISVDVPQDLEYAKEYANISLKNK